MNKRITLGLALTAIIAFSVAVWSIHNQIVSMQIQIGELQAQNSELQQQNDNLQNEISVLQNRISDLQDQLRKKYTGSLVKITAVEWIGGFNPIVGVTLIHPVNVTINNNSPNSVSGLSITVKLLHKYYGTDIGTTGGVNVGTLQAGETREIATGAYTTIDTSLENAVCIVTLKLDDTILDEWIHNI